MILVTGATGIIGRPLIELLREAGADVRALTRDPQTAKLPPGVEVIEGNPAEPATVAGALQGVTALHGDPDRASHGHHLAA